MERKGLKKCLPIIIGIFSLVIILTGCGKSSKVKTVTVGSMNIYRPFIYRTKSGKNTGYEIAVLKAIDKHLPQYKFKYTHAEFANLFPMLKNRKIDMIANQIELNKERKKQYQYSKVGYTNYNLYIESFGKKYQNLSQLAGKTAYVVPGANEATLLEKWNKKHPNQKIKLVYGNWSDQLLVKNFQKKTIDATLNTKMGIDFLNKSLGANLLRSSKPVNYSSTYYLFRKNDTAETKLNEAVSKQLTKMKKNGELKKISIKYLGGDYTK